MYSLNRKNYRGNMKDSLLTELITDARGGSDTAFAKLVEQYTPMLKSLATNFMGTGFSYGEAYSEACLAFHRAVISYDLSRSDVTFGLYAKICVYRRLCDAVARLSKEQNIVDIDMDSIVVDCSIENRMMVRERLDNYIRTAKTVLSDYEFSVFLLYIDGYSTAEISKKLSKSAKSVDNAKARYFKRLREESFKFSDF